MIWTRRAMLAGLLAGAAMPLRAEAPATSLLPRRRGDGGARRAGEQPLEALIAAAKLAGTLGVVVADAATGAVLEAHEPDLPQPPASVAKTITALYALDRLGPQHRFATRVIVTGPVVNGRLEGDLVLAGGGDPELDTDMLGDLAAELAARGLREITGRYLVWGGALPQIGRIDGEQPDFVGYNPALSGLNLNFNRVHFEWKQASEGYALSMDARAARFVPPVRMARMRVERREQPVFTYESGEAEDRWTVAASALGREGSRWMPVRHPEVYAAEVFQTLCAAQGIALPEALPVVALPEGEILAAHRSAALETVLRGMLKYSTNLTAEVAGLAASQAATLRASGRAMAEWARLRHGIGADFVDHSGLGAASRICARDMVRALAAAQTGPLPELLKDVGLRDSEGRPVKGSPVRVLAKTGTLNFVSGLAGYIVPPGGRRLAFAIYAADLPRRAQLGLAERESPPGGDAWLKRARKLQGDLVSRWVRQYA